VETKLDKKMEPTPFSESMSLPTPTKTLMMSTNANANANTNTCPSTILTNFLQHASSATSSATTSTSSNTSTNISTSTISSTYQFNQLIEELKRCSQQKIQLPVDDNVGIDISSGAVGDPNDEETKKECHVLNCKLTILISHLIQHYSNSSNHANVRSNVNSNVSGNVIVNANGHVNVMNTIFQSIQFLFSKNGNRNLPFWKCLFRLSNHSDNADGNGNNDDGDDDDDNLIMSLLEKISATIMSASMEDVICKLPQQLYGFFYQYYTRNEFLVSTSSTSTKKRKRSKRSWIAIQQQISNSVHSCLGYILSYIIVQLEQQKLQLQHLNNNEEGEEEESYKNWNEINNQFQYFIKIDTNANTTKYDSYQLGLISFMLDCMIFSSNYYHTFRNNDDEMDDEMDGIRLCIVPSVGVNVDINGNGDDNMDHGEDSSSFTLVEGMSVSFVTKLLIDNR
jgi:hypothetical protein